MKVGSYVADIVGENGIIEIQTRNFVKLKPKLAELLELSRVTVVHPLIYEKRIINIDSETGEVTSSRKSPKHGNIYLFVHELYAIKPLLNNARLSIKLPVLKADEFRKYGVHTNRRKKQHTRRGEYVSDIMPTDILDEITLASREDYSIFIPSGLPESFSSDVFARIAGADVYAARRILNILEDMGHVCRSGKQGRRVLWRLTASLTKNT